jgi:quinol monooxygenase YgiN
MPVFTVARFEVRPEAREQAERAMHEFATYVRTELDDSSWTTYRDPKAPAKYMSLIVADSPAAVDRHRNAAGTQAFVAALYPLLVGEIEFTHYDLVTSSDLGRRHRR